jgi:hypothetical protein
MRLGELLCLRARDFLDGRPVMLTGLFSGMLRQWGGHVAFGGGA